MFPLPPRSSHTICSSTFLPFALEVRDILNRHASLVTAVAGVLLAVTFGLLIWRLLGGGGSSEQGERVPMAYFYDQNTRELFVLPANTTGPVDRPSGTFQGEPAGVRAHVYACGQCSDESLRFIGYLSKPLPPDQQPKNEPPLELVKRPKDEMWYRSDSPEAGRITGAPIRRCKGTARANYCRPPAEYK